MDTPNRTYCRFFARLALVLLAAGGLSAASARGDTITVCWDGTGDHLTIQAGIDAAVNDDVVVVCPGTYYENIDFLGKAITVRSQYLEASDPGEAGAIIANTIIDGGGVDSVVTFASDEGRDSILAGLTIQNGLGWTYDDGGGLVVAGGGVSCRKSSPTIRDNLIQDNQAPFIGGGMSCHTGCIANICAPLVVGNVFRNNHAGDDYPDAEAGGAIGLGTGVVGETVIQNNLIIDNTADGYGGGIYVGSSSDGCSVTITYNTISGNSADDGGGGLAVVSDNTDVVVDSSIFWNDTSGLGPEILLGAGTLTVRYSDVQGGQGDVYVVPSGTLTWGAGNIDAAPEFEDGYYLSQDSAGDPPPHSLCVDAGNDELPIPDGTTRTDYVADEPPPDMGYHYVSTPGSVGACCYPDASCAEIPAAWCDGAWVGAGTTCEPNLCQPIECSGDSLFDQPPLRPDEDWFFGYSDADWGDNGLVRYERFEHILGDICDVHWWGILSDGKNPCVEEPMTFELAFYEDDGSTAPAGTPTTYTVSVTPENTHYQYDVEGTFHDLYYFSVDLETQPGGCVPMYTDDPQWHTGWVSIQALAGDPGCLFAWAASDAGEGKSWVHDGQDFTVVCNDLSLCLTGEEGAPILGACCYEPTGDCFQGEMTSCWGSGYRFEPYTLCADLDPPCGAYCPENSVFAPNPPDGAIDARKPHRNDSTTPCYGFGMPDDPGTATDESLHYPIVIDLGVTGASDMSCWSLCETPDMSASPCGSNSIVSVTEAPVGVYTIGLAHGVAAGTVTTIQYNEGDYVSYIHHPANADGSAAANAADILYVVDCLNAPGTCQNYEADIDASSIQGANDIIEEVNLLNGASAYDPWFNTPLPENECSCP